MPNPNVNVIMTKFVLRNDIYENWQVSTIVLEKGEPAIEINLEKRTSKIKIGDGVHTFSELPYCTVTTDEIQAMIDASMTEGGAINSVSLSSGTNNGTLKLTVNGTDYDNIAVTGLGTAAYTDASAYATAAQGARADLAMLYKGSINELPSVLSAGDTFSVFAEFMIPSDMSETGDAVAVVAGDIITVKENGKVVVMPAGVADTAKSLTEGISAAVTGGVTGTATAANAGETMNIEVTEVNADYLVAGTKIIILNGGSAAG